MGWIAVDFDGTLCGLNNQPLMPMIELVKKFLIEGKEVKIFTAKAVFPEYCAEIDAFNTQHFGKLLEITDRKDFRTEAIYDDRAFRVEYNTGLLLS